MSDFYRSIKVMESIQVLGTKKFLGNEIPVIEGGFGEGEKVVLAKTVAEIHGMELGEVNRLINDNIDEFENGVDILNLMNDEFKVGATHLGFITSNRQKYCYLLSEQGYMALVGLMRTDKARELRKQFRREYFAMRSKSKQDPYENLSTEMKALLMHDKKIQAVQKEVIEVKEDLTEFKDDIPLFTVECEEISKAVKRVGTKALGGKGSKAYKDKSLRAKVYSDIHRQLKREFDVNSYKAIKRRYLKDAIDIVENYNLTIVLSEQISMLNNQVAWA